MNRFGTLALAGAAMVLAAGGFAGPAMAQFREPIGNDLSQCSAGGGPAVRVTVTGIKSSAGKIRVQSYHATAAEWLESGKWLNRIEVPARAGSMTFCMPFDASGSYGIVARHDVNGNGKTEISTDGGAMSNNPSINIFNLGKPSYKKTAISVGPGVTSITINMRYM